MGFKFRLRSIAAVIGTMMLVPIVLVGNVSARPLSKTDKDFLLKSIERAEVDSQMVSSKEGMILEANGQTYDRINNLALGKKLKVYAVCDGSECKKLSFTISDGRGSQTSSKEDQPLVGNNLKVFSAEILAESPNYDFYLRGCLKSFEWSTLMPNASP